MSKILSEGPVHVQPSLWQKVMDPKEDFGTEQGREGIIKMTGILTRKGMS